MTANQTAPAPPAATELTSLTERLYQDGIIGPPGRLHPRLGRDLGEDIMAAFDEARAARTAPSVAGRTATTSRSTPRRCAASSSWPATPGCGAVSEAVLGPDYRIVEVGFDIPLSRRDEPALAPRLPDARRRPATSAG